MQVIIKDKEYGLHWGLGAVEISAEIFDLNPDTLLFNSIIFEIENEEVNFNKPVMVDNRLVFGAILNYCDQNDITFDLTYTKFRNAYNDFDLEVHEQLVNDFKKSKYVGKIVEELLNEAIAKINPVEEPKTTAKKKKPTLSK